MIRTLVFWGLYWGPLILGNYHIRLMHDTSGRQRQFPTSLPFHGTLNPKPLIQAEKGRALGTEISHIVRASNAKDPNVV